MNFIKIYFHFILTIIQFSNKHTEMIIYFVYNYTIAVIVSNTIETQMTTPKFCMKTIIYETTRKNLPFQNRVSRPYSSVLRPQGYYA